MKVLSQGGHKADFGLLLREEKEGAQILDRHGWWALRRDISGPVQREILGLSIARTSVMRYKNSREPLDRLGHELGVQ